MLVIRWFTRNLSSLILAFILAVIVWVSAVTATDPSQERSFQVPIEPIGQDTNVIRINEIPDTLDLTLYAPNSLLDEVEQSNGNLRAWVDLTGLGEGSHTVPVEYQVPENIQPVRVVDASPRTVSISLEATISRTLPIEIEVRGEPALGYQIEDAIWSHQEVTISGRSSQVNKVARVPVTLDIDGITETIERTFSLRPVDAEGNVVSDVTLNPERVSVTQPVSLQGGYRNVVIRVTTRGTVADGYRTTNITPTPSSVLVFSDDPSLVESLPGYVETEPVDLTGATDDIEEIVALDLPDGVTVTSDPTVLVQVGIAALETSITVTKQVETIGLAPGLQPAVSPNLVDVILFGPIPDLNELEPLDVRIVVDLTGLGVGVHSLEPSVEILPSEISYESIQPETVEVIISLSPTPTATPITTPTATTIISPSIALTSTLESTPTGD